ncbi:MAG: sigma-70 family RNA polymerase sigma factor [Planctomycetia bacterium]|nr:sigma-70 family RNA polymerase sigma factor [Planctomycetia bacterium]
METCPLADVVRAAQQGEREAQAELVRRYQPAVEALARRHLRNQSDAQELAQDAFIQALRRLDQVREPERFGGWLRSIVVRMAINRVTRRRPMSGGAEILESAAVETETPLDHALAAERAAWVRSGLRKLRKLDRQTLEAFYLRGQSLVEMSDTFDSPVGTIKRRLHVARRRLAEQLGDHAVA